MTVYNIFRRLLPRDFAGKIYEYYLRSRFARNIKREKMGIFYTPFYVVDYIVENSVTNYIEGMSIDEILDVKILDPSCGSGRFLVKSFEVLCRSVEDRLRKNEFSSNWKVFDYFDGKLDRDQKATILFNCIYGIDLDDRAAKICRFNLRISSSFMDVGDDELNIVCADAILDEVFDLDFDLVIGGPPYGSYIKFRDRRLIGEQYNFGTTYSTVIFMAFAKNVTKKGGMNVMIVPKKVFVDDNLNMISGYLGEGLFDIVDFGQVWEEVPLEEVVYFYRKKNGIS